MIDGTLVTHRGGCHCGAVRFEVDAPAALIAYDCNCSICRRSGYLHLEVPRSRFRLLTDDAALTTYIFNTGVAKHLFCPTCGIKSFYVPRSCPQGYSVNVNCLEADTIESVEVHSFDGEHWEEAMAQRPPPDFGDEDKVG